MPPPSLFVFSFLLFLLPLLFLLILVFCLRFLSLIVVCFFFFFSDSVSSFSSFYLHPLFSFFFLLSPPLCYVHCPWLSRSAFVCRCVFVRPSLFISVSVSVFFFSVSVSGSIAVAIGVLRCSDVAVQPPLSVPVLPSFGVIAVSVGPVRPFYGLPSLSSYLYSLRPSVVWPPTLRLLRPLYSVAIQMSFDCRCCLDAALVLSVP